MMKKRLDMRSGGDIFTTKTDMTRDITARGLPPSRVAMVRKYREDK
jgi:hypothetical protein